MMFDEQSTVAISLLSRVTSNGSSARSNQLEHVERVRGTKWHQNLDAMHRNCRHSKNSQSPIERQQDGKILLSAVVARHASASIHGRMTAHEKKKKTLTKDQEYNPACYMA